MESAACLPRSGFVQQLNAGDAKSRAPDFVVRLIFFKYINQGGSISVL
jgi:hypothetical protein